MKQNQTNYRTEKHQHSQNLTETCAIGIMTEWLWKMRKGTLLEQINIARIRIVGINRSTFQSFQSFHHSRNVRKTSLKSGHLRQFDVGSGCNWRRVPTSARDSRTACVETPQLLLAWGCQTAGPSWPSHLCHLCLPLTSQNPKSPFFHHLKDFEGT